MRIQQSNQTITPAIPPTIQATIPPTRHAHNQCRFSKTLRHRFTAICFFGFFSCLLLCLFLNRSLMASQGAPETKITAPSTWKSPPKEVAIDGLTSFIFHHDPSSRLTVLRLFINGGEKAESAEKKGLAFLTTRMALEVTEPTKLRKLMTIGSISNTQVEGDHSIITIKCLSEHLDDTLKIYLKELTNPLFSSLRIPNTKKGMIYFQKNEEDTPEHALNREALTSFFGAGGYGGSLFGTKKSLNAIKRKDVQQFYKKYFNLANMTICISSDKSEEEVKKVLGKYLEKMPRGETRHRLPTIKVIPPEAPGDYFFPRDTNQTVISLAALLPPLKGQNFVCAYMLENILGDGIGSKLWRLRRVDHLAYHLAARATHMKDAGLLRVLLKTDTSRKEKALKALLTVVRTLHEKGITQEELKAARLRCRVRFLRANESKEGRTYYLGFFHSIGDDFSYTYLEDFFNHLDTISLETFNGYIREALRPERLVQLITGPETSGIEKNKENKNNKEN